MSNPLGPTRAIPSSLLDETIVAISTPLGRGAIAVVRVSGSQAHVMAQGMIELWPAAPRRTTLCTVRARSGEKLDEALITVFEAPNSFTGEPVVELSVHGGVAVAPAVVAEFVARGARLAEPGEYTRRAVLHGKLDLVQAEAIGELVEARSSAMRRAAIAQLDGRLTERIAQLRNELIDLQALLVYDIDFPEEDDGPISEALIDSGVGRILVELDELLKTAPAVESLREGAIVVIAGEPNVGKSSLFNALIGKERAIVSSVPGTTRDAIDAIVEIGKWPVRLVDTAGSRETVDVVERLGIEVSERYVKAATVIVVCGETRETLERAIARVEALGTAPLLAVHTKADLGDRFQLSGPIQMKCITLCDVSTATGEGLAEFADKLEVIVRDRFGNVELDSPLLLKERQQALVKKAQEALVTFRRSWQMDGIPAAVSSVLVQEAVLALAEVVGEVNLDEVLGRVFSRFCVGK